ncbi:hypothetical protein [Corynebacterium aquilae]|uniref:Uncharacterized protein n=1 Tax=Corynebacterium aquilae DSM 44791 TaxID=1431546 RepID=A0A1L7CFA8_9CORY|nr:hypothetical protein [Corynebacterium aquilae]APT84516.1 hypothetical protein CAQU_04980 [Corynebacterium aquilae DSM 44791]
MMVRVVGRLTDVTGQPSSVREVLVRSARTRPQGIDGVVVDEPVRVEVGSGGAVAFDVVEGNAVLTLLHHSDVPVPGHVHFESVPLVVAPGMTLAGAVAAGQSVDSAEFDQLEQLAVDAARAVTQVKRGNREVQAALVQVRRLIDEGLQDGQVRVKHLNSEVKALIDGKAGKKHQHAMGDVTGLDAALKGKADKSHTHPMSQVVGLDDALAGKAPKTHTHSTAQVTGLDAALKAKADVSALGGKAAKSHTHAMSQVTGLDAALGGKAAKSHTHSMGDVSGLDTALRGKADTADLQRKADKTHTHSMGDVTGLDDALRGKVDASLLDDTKNGAQGTVVVRNRDGHIQLLDEPPYGDSAVNRRYVEGKVAECAPASHKHPLSDISDIPNWVDGTDPHLIAKNRLCVRRSTGGLRVADPEIDDDAATKRYVDKASGGSISLARIEKLGASGTFDNRGKILGVNWMAEPNTIPVRTNGGQMRVGDPNVDDEAASKRYVDRIAGGTIPLTRLGQNGSSGTLAVNGTVKGIHWNNEQYTLPIRTQNGCIRVGRAVHDDDTVSKGYMFQELGKKANSRHGHNASDISGLDKGVAKVLVNDSKIKVVANQGTVQFIATERIINSDLESVKIPAGYRPYLDVPLTRDLVAKADGTIEITGFYGNHEATAGMWVAAK